MTAFLQDRDLFPKTHDDCSYVIGMQMLARGRLWMPALPLPDFFDSFYILVRPVYCSLYFHGDRPALRRRPSGWACPTWLMPALASGMVVALMYRIIAEQIDGIAGLLAALMVMSLSWFRVYSMLVTSHVPVLLLGLLLVWSWMKWPRWVSTPMGAWLWGWRRDGRPSPGHPMPSFLPSPLPWPSWLT